MNEPLAQMKSAGFSAGRNSGWPSDGGSAAGGESSRFRNYERTPGADEICGVLRRQEFGLAKRRRIRRRRGILSLPPDYAI